MTRAELIEAITEAARPKFKMTKPSRRNGDMPTLYQQQLALVLAKRAKKDKTFSGRLKLIRAKIDNSLKGKSGGPHHPMFRWGESLEENQITVGRHDPRKLNKRLNSPTGGDSRFRPLPPRDKKPLQAPKQLGRRRINEIHAEHPFGGKTTIVRTFNMAPDTWRDKAQGYVYTGKKNPTTLERMVGMERGYSAIDPPMFTHADINSQVRSTVNRKVGNIRKAWQGKRVIREDLIGGIIESVKVNLASPKEVPKPLSSVNSRYRERNFSNVALPTDLGFAARMGTMGAPKVVQNLAVKMANRSQKGLNQNVQSVAHHIPSGARFAGQGLEALVFKSQQGQNPDNWSVFRVSQPKRPLGVKKRPESAHITPSISSKRVGRFQIDQSPFRLVGPDRSSKRGLASTSVLYNMAKEGLVAKDAHNFNIGVHPKTGKEELIDPGFVQRLNPKTQKRVNDYLTRTDPTSMPSSQFRDGLLAAAEQSSGGILGNISSFARTVKNAPIPIANSLNVIPQVPTLSQAKRAVPMIRQQGGQISGSGTTSQARNFIARVKSAAKFFESREDIINAIIESALANAAGGGGKWGGGAVNSAGQTSATRSGGSGIVISNNSGKGPVNATIGGVGGNLRGALGGGFGSSGTASSRFSGGGQKFGSRATAAAGVKDVGHGGSFGAPVGSKMSPGGPASRGQTTSAFTGGGSRPTGTASSTGGAQVQAKAPTPAPKAAATSNTGQSQNRTPSPAPKAANSVPPVGGGDKTQHNKRDLNPGNISQSQRQAGSNIMHNQAARTGAPNMQRERAFAAGTGGRFAGGGPRPMGGGGSYGGGGSSWGHSQSGYRNTTNFNIGGSVGFGGGSSRGRIGANFGSSRMNYGSRSSGYYSGR